MVAMASSLGMGSVIQAVVFALVITTGIYAAFLTLLIVPFFQNQAIYLHGVKLTWFQDVNAPEHWGFLRNQVTPFMLSTPDGESLHAWHILPLNQYRKHESELIAEPSGLANDIKSRLSFKLLRDDPEARLVLYFHGAAGTLGSGYRPPSYRAISATAPDKIHIVAIDYRGFGMSTGSPSEHGLLTDALALADWALEEAGISSDRIAIFAQSLGTAVSISLMRHLAALPEPVLFSGAAFVAPFANVEELTATYRLAGTVPLLDPVAKFPRLLAFFNRFIRSKWPSKDKLAEFIRRCEGMGPREEGERLRYHIDIIHAEDDYDIPWSHSETVFWHAVNASMPNGISLEDLEEYKRKNRNELGVGGWVAARETKVGVIRESILKYGLHDKTMSYPVVSLAIARALRLD